MFLEQSESVKVLFTSVTPRTVTHQASLSMEFPRQEYWSGFPFPSPGHLPNPGIELASLVLCIGRQILYISATWEAPCMCILCFCNHVHPSFSTSIIILHIVECICPSQSPNWSHPTFPLRCPHICSLHLSLSLLHK